MMIEGSGADCRVVAVIGQPQQSGFGAKLAAFRLLPGRPRRWGKRERGVFMDAEIRSAAVDPRSRMV